MPIADKTGSNIRVGHLVDVIINGALTCEVVEVHDSAIVSPNGPARPDHIKVSAIIALPVQGSCCPVYVVGRSKRLGEQDDDANGEAIPSPLRGVLS
jgi:hypothetical protein